MSVYVITNGADRYLKRNEFSGKTSEVDNLSLATSWDTYGRASGFLKKYKPKRPGTTWSVLEIPYSQCVAAQSTSEQPQQDKTMRVMSVADIKEAGQVPVQKSCVRESTDVLSTFASFVDDKRKQKDELARQHSVVEREILDIQHYIEFHDLNAYQGWLVFKLLQQKLRTRRSLKDSIQAIGYIESCPIDTQQIKNAASSINGLSGRKYTPRELDIRLD